MAKNMEVVVVVEFNLLWLGTSILEVHDMNLQRNESGRNSGRNNEYMLNLRKFYLS